MEFELIFKIAGLGIVISIINTILSKAGRDEYVMLTSLAGIIIISLMLIDQITELFASLQDLFKL